MRKVAVVFTLFYLFDFISAKYPTDLKRCHYGDTECLKQTISEYAVLLAGGRRELGLVSIDPLQVDEVEIIDETKNRPVNLNLKFRKLKCTGLSQAKIKNVIGFGADPVTSKFEIQAEIPQISMIGQYMAKGNILLLPIYGNGASNLTFENVDATIKFVTKVDVKKGKQYLRISNLLLDFDTARLWMNFENLFNGDKLLSQTTNQFLNDNWTEILKELKPVLKKTIAGIYKAIAEPIFNKYPYEELFLDGDM